MGYVFEEVVFGPAIPEFACSQVEYTVAASEEPGVAVKFVASDGEGILDAVSEMVGIRAADAPGPLP